MSQRVYLVTQGCYSDYTVRAAFTTREAAEAYVSHLSDGQPSYDSADVEEFPLDAPLEELPGGWMVQVREDGTVRSSFHSWTLGRPSDPAVRKQYHDGVCFEGHGITQEHARRSAEELRRAVLAGTVVTEGAD